MITTVRSAPFFNHKDPAQAADYAYDQTCVARFRRACDRGATLLLIEELGGIEEHFDALCAV